MKIIFKQIEIHNFMSFADETFDFSNQYGLNLVTGKNLDIPSSKNGVGKSNIFCALLWGLYGQLANKIKTENIANRYLEDKEVRVVVYLDVDNISYKVVSGLNKRASGYFNLYIVKDGEDVDITKSTIAESRDYFENQILHCDISLFLRTILLTSEQNYNFFNLKKQDKKDFIEKLFDIGLFGDMYEKIHKDVLNTEKSISTYQTQLITLTSNQDDYISRINTFDKQLQNEREQISIQIVNAEKTLTQILSESVEKNIEMIKKCELAQQKLNNARADITDKMSAKKSEIQQLNTERMSYIRIVESNKKIIDTHQELFEQLCDDCKLIFDKYHNLSIYKNEISKNNKQINSIINQINNEKIKYQDLSVSLVDIDNKLTKISSKLHDLNNESDIVKQKQINAEQHLNVLKSNMKQIENKINPYLELLENVKSKIVELSAQLNTLTNNYNYLKAAETIVSHDSLKKFIIKDLIGLINNKIKTYLMKMGAKYTCVFDENLDYTFITDSGTCELQNFSCGEKKRLEIATCLSFRDFIAQRSNISSNILILDEYIDSGIDTLAVESILNILTDFTKIYNQNIFIISHRAEVNNDIFSRTIELQKHNGISTIHYNK